MAIIKNYSKFEDNKFVVKSINNNFADANGNITLQLDGQHIPTAIVNIAVDNKSGIITCTKGDGSSFQVDTLLEKVVTNFTYDNATKSLNLSLEDGTIQQVSLSALVKEYNGKTGTTIDVTVEQSSGNISAEVKNTSISKTHLATELVGEIDGKETIVNVDRKLQEKANTTHKHNATDIAEDETHRFVTDEEKNKWDNSTEILDTEVSDTKTWSSQKIQQQINEAQPSGLEEIQSDVEKLKTDVGSVKTKLINNFNSVVDTM